jgi:hypothetical protein
LRGSESISVNGGANGAKGTQGSHGPTIVNGAARMPIKFDFGTNGGAKAPQGGRGIAKIAPHDGYAKRNTTAKNAG